MECGARCKVKVEPCENSEGHDDSDDVSKSLTLEIKTEDGDKIVIKQEKTFVTDFLPDTPTILGEGERLPEKIKTESNSEYMKAFTNRSVKSDSLSDTSVISCADEAVHACIKTENTSVPKTVLNRAADLNVSKVKVEHCQKGEGQHDGNVENDEKIVIKQEKDKDDSIVSDTLLGTPSIITLNESAPEQGEIKKIPEPQSLLRKALFDFTGPISIFDKPHVVPMPKKKDQSSLPVAAINKNLPSDVGVRTRSSILKNQSSYVKKIKLVKLNSKQPVPCVDKIIIKKSSAKHGVTSTSSDEKDDMASVVGVAVRKNLEVSHSPNVSNVTDSQESATVQDTVSLEQADKSHKLKFVFNRSGILKAFRIEGEESDKTMPLPASNLGKIIKLEDVMKKKNSGDTNSEPGLPTLKRLHTLNKAETSVSPAKKMLMSEGEASAGSSTDVSDSSLDLPKTTVQLVTTASVTTTTASAALSSSETVTNSSSTKNSDLLLHPRPVTLVSSQDISKYGAAAPVNKLKQRPFGTEIVDHAVPTSTVSSCSSLATVSTSTSDTVSMPVSYTSEQASRGAEAVASTSSERVYTCSMCCRVFKNHSLFQQHMKIHSNQKPFLCGLCDNRYCTHLELASHLQEIHTEEEQGDTLEFTCSHCGKNFDKGEELLAHLKKHEHVEIETVFECGMCGKEFNSKPVLQDHIKKHSCRCRCGICIKAFADVDTLRRHLVQEHFKFGQLCCEVCNCRFMTLEALKAHMPVHEQLGEAELKAIAKHFPKGRLECGTCKRQFQRCDALKAHARVHDSHPYKCKYCNRMFKEKLERMDHMKKDHINRPFFDCNFCSLSFLTVENLKAHVKSHSVMAYFL